MKIKWWRPNIYADIKKNVNFAMLSLPSANALIYWICYNLRLIQRYTCVIII